MAAPPALTGGEQPEVADFAAVLQLPSPLPAAAAAASSPPAVCCPLPCLRARARRRHVYWRDLYLWANAVNVGCSAAYCALDVLSAPLPAGGQDAAYATLSALFVVDALLYLAMWQGAAPGAWPTDTDILAEYTNVASSALYLAGTGAALTAQAAARAISLSSSAAAAAAALLAVISDTHSAAILIGLATYMFLVEALLYLAAWLAADCRAARARAAAGEPRARGRGCALADVYMHANGLNVIAAATYAACATANIVLYNNNALLVRGAGRLPMGVAAPGIGIACIVADFAYLADSLLFTLAWLRDVEDEEVEAEAAAKLPPSVAEQLPASAYYTLCNPLVRPPCLVTHETIILM